jgi:hypothetical protein
MLKFSKANAKIEKLQNKYTLRKYTKNGRKVYSFDLLSGWSCPCAKECLSKVHEINGVRKLIDGKDTKFRCFSASQEIAFPAVYNLRKHNYDMLKPLSKDEMVELILKSMPEDLGILRWHVDGDFFNQKYFDAAIEVAESNPDKLFYAYTKSLNFWIKRQDKVNSLRNFVLTASLGGRLDHLIDEHNLRYSKVVFSEQEAKDLGLEIDHDDYHAAYPRSKQKSFSLLIHGIQPKGSEASKALQLLKKNKVKYSYSRKVS